MRRIRLAVWVCFVLVYAVCVFFVFRSTPVKAQRVDSAPVRGDIVKDFGNGGLKCLLILLDGRAELVDGESEIKTQSLFPSRGGTRFVAGCLTPSETVFLVDDRNVVYRIPKAGSIGTSKPLKLDGDLMAIAAEERRNVLWIAVKRSAPEPGDLFVLTVNLANGKVLNSTNLGPQGDVTSFLTGPHGDIVSLTANKIPGAFFFDFRDKEVFSKYVSSVDLVTSIAFDGDDPILGLRSGGVLLLDAQSWTVKKTIETDPYPVNFISVADGKIGIGHGGQSKTAQVGSFQLVNSKTGEIEGVCGSTFKITSGIATQSGKRSIYGLQSGEVKTYSEEDGCQSVVAPSELLPGRVIYMGCQWPTCLVVGADQILRLEFKP